MARTRNLKPSVFLNESLAACEPLARWLFAGLWCWADFDGRLEDRPLKIKAAILPHDNCDVNDLLNQLHRAGVIVRYQADGVKAIQIVSWSKHGNPHPKEPSLGLPCCCENAETSHDKSGLVLNNSLSSLTLTSSLTNPPLPPTGGDATAEQPKPRKPTDAPAPGFDAFWEAYPRKDAKKNAVRAWNSLRPDPLLQGVILDALTRQRQSKQWLRDNGQFIPLPATYLNGRRWEDQGASNGSSFKDEFFAKLRTKGS